MIPVSLSGVGVVNEDPHRLGDLAHRTSMSELPNVRWSSTPNWSGLPSKDRKVLGSGDIMAVEAASHALVDAGLEGSCLLEDMGCIVFNTGKGSRVQELRQVRTRFRTSEQKPDMAALFAAIKSGEVTVDPFVLLHDLDNTTLWWLCKRYPVGSINLQICQPNVPAYYALLEGVESIAHGECNLCLVGGYQTVDVSAVHVRHLGGPTLDEEDARLAGGAAFVVLRRAEPGRRSYGRLVASPSGSLPATVSDVRVEPAGAPALRPMLELVLGALRLGKNQNPIVITDPEVRGAPPITFVPEER